MLLLQQPVNTKGQKQGKHVRQDGVKCGLELDGLQYLFALDGDLLRKLDGSLNAGQDAGNEPTHYEQGGCARNISNAGNGSAAHLVHQAKALLVSKPESGEHQIEPDEPESKHKPGTACAATKRHGCSKHGKDGLHQDGHDGIADASERTHQGNLQTVADLGLLLLFKEKNK